MALTTITVTVADVASAAGMSRQAIYNAVDTGRLSSEKDEAGQTMIKLADAIEFCVARGGEEIELRATFERRAENRVQGAKAAGPGNWAQRSSERFKTNVFGGQMPKGRFEIGRLEHVRQALDKLYRSFHAEHNKFSKDDASSVIHSVQAYAKDFCERVERIAKSK